MLTNFGAPVVNEVAFSARVPLGQLLDEIKVGVGPDWRLYKLLGASKYGLTPAKEPIGKQPGRYKYVGKGAIFYNPMRILIGSIALVDNEEHQGIVSPDYVALRPNSKRLLPRFFYSWLRSRDGANAILDSAKGAVRERMMFESLAKIEIPLPDIDQQRRFEHIYGVIQDERARNDNQLDDLTRAPKAAINSWLADIRKAHGEQKLSDYAPEDDCFRDGPFGSNLKTAHYAKCGARVIRLQNIGDGRFLDADCAYVPLDHYETIKRHNVHRGDVVVACLGDGVRAAGRACVVPELGGPAVVKADCFRVRLPDTAIDPNYLKRFPISLYHIRRP